MEYTLDFVYPNVKIRITRVDGRDVLKIKKWLEGKSENSFTVTINDEHVILLKQNLYYVDIKETKNESEVSLCDSKTNTEN